MNRKTFLTTFEKHLREAKRRRGQEAENLRGGVLDYWPFVSYAMSLLGDRHQMAQSKNRWECRKLLYEKRRFGGPERRDGRNHEGGLAFIKGDTLEFRSRRNEQKRIPNPIRKTSRGGEEEKEATRRRPLVLDWVPKTFVSHAMPLFILLRHQMGPPLWSFKGDGLL